MILTQYSQETAAEITIDRVHPSELNLPITNLRIGKSEPAVVTIEKGLTPYHVLSLHIISLVSDVKI